MPSPPRWQRLGSGSMPKCWIVGPIAWDFPYRIPSLPSSGQFIQAIRMPGRLGGTGANVARALASRNEAVGMVGYVGRDKYGERNVQDMQARGIDVSQVEKLSGETSQVLLFLEPSGERTIVGVAADNLSKITMPSGAIHSGDLVYFAAWREEFEPALRDVESAGAIVACVPFRKPLETLPVSYVIGSMSEVPEPAGDIWARYKSWTGGKLKYMVLTLGSQGVRLLSSCECRELPAMVVQAVDTTGAGDAFAAAILAAILDGRPMMSGVHDGLAWGGATAQRESSIPPPWPDVLSASQPS